MTSLSARSEKLIEIGAKVVRYGRYVTFQLAEIAIPRRWFAEILRLIAGLRPITARADIMPCVIAGAELNWRVPGARHLPNERLQIPNCTLAGSPTHRAAYLKVPI